MVISRLTCPPRWYPLAKREWRTVAHSHYIWLLTLFQLLLGYNWVYSSHLVRSVLGPTLSVAAAQPGVAYGIPFTTLAFSFRSIVAEQESGSIRYTAGTAITRRDVLIGKAVGIFAGILVPALMGIALTILIGIGLVTKSIPPTVVVLLFCGTTIVYLAIFTSIGIAISALARNSTQGLAIVFSTLLFGVFSWKPIGKLVFDVVKQLFPLSNQMLYALGAFLPRLGITNAFLIFTNGFIDQLNSHYLFNIAISTTLDTNTNPLVMKFGSPLPFYLQPWFAVVILLGWLTIPFAIALYQFDSADLTSGGTNATWFQDFIRKTRHNSRKFRERASTRLPTFSWHISHRVRWGPLARREYRAVRQSLGPAVIFCLILSIGFLDFPSTDSWLLDQVGTTAAVATYQRGIAFVVLFAAIILTFRSISGERDTGSITLTSGTAITRIDLILGKFIGRTLALLVPVYAALFVGIFLSSMIYGVPSLWVVLGFLVLVTLYTIVCTGIGVSVSAITSKTTSSGVLALIFVFITYLWFNLGPTTYFIAAGHTANLFSPPADPLLFLSRRPTVLESFLALTNSVFGLPNSSYFYNSSIPEPHGISNILIVDTTFNGNAPFYLHSWFSLVFLLCWLVVPLAIALLVFRRSDLT